MRLLPPDDAADLIQAAGPEHRDALLALLDEPTRKEVTALLAYAEDEAGGLMSPRYARLRPDMTVDEAITYLRRQAREQLETIYYIYVLDAEQHLLGVVSFRELFAAPSDKTVRDVMRTDFVTAHETMDQEALSRLFSTPRPDRDSRSSTTTGASRASSPSTTSSTWCARKPPRTSRRSAAWRRSTRRTCAFGFGRMIRKRAGWLSALFLGEMLTATAMGYFEDEIARAVVLALFVPLIISSGGNSGSQATTLVIRAMALGEVRLRDWWRVIRRELASGLALGSILASIGIVRILLWQAFFGTYGEHYLLDRAHGRRQPGRRGDLRDARRLDAAVRAAPPRLRPRQRLGAVRRDAGRRDGAGDLLHGRERGAARGAAVRGSE